MAQGTCAVLALAVGVAISPVPIIAVILTLFSQRAEVNGPGKALGTGRLPLVGGEKARSCLDELTSWLAVHNSAVMAVLFLVFGVDLIAKGLPPLF